MIRLANNAGSSLVVAILATDAVAQIQTADAARFPVLEYPGDVFPARLRDGAGNIEYVLVTARDGNNITMLRGREGTTARDFPAGAAFELVVTGEAWDRLAESRWVRPLDAARAPLLPTRIDAATFTLPGDVTALFAPNRALHLIQTASAYGYVSTSAFAGGTTTVVVQNCVVDVGLALVELGLEVESAPKYGNAANADTLGGSSKAQVIAEALTGTAANSSNLGGSSKAQVIAEALAGTAANSSKLEGKTKAEVIAEAVAAVSAIPVGTTISMAGETVPAGFLEENGAAVSRATYATLFACIGTTHGQGDGSTTFNLPDSRGEFHRGWDHGRGVDPDRASRTAAATGGLTGDHVGTAQADEYRSHSHRTAGTWGSTGNGGSWQADEPANGTDAGKYSLLRGGNETRPRNRTRMYCIKY